MAATLPPIDRDVLAGLRAGDEQSLERIFRDSYTPLIQAAKRPNLDEAAASRVVERAVLQAWGDRAQFDSQASLESFLNETVQRGASREESRLSGLRRVETRESGKAHKNATTAAAPTVDTAWSHIMAALHPAEMHDNSAIANRARHETASHMARMSKRKFPIAAVGGGIVLAAVVGGGLWWLHKIGEDSAVARELASGQAHKVTTAPGQIGKVNLDDSSHVQLGPSSALYIAPKFPAEMRAVKVEGTAAITVAKGQLLPLEVRAGNAAIIATGTVILINAYPKDSTATIAVRDGSVTVKVGKQTKQLASGQAVFVPKEENAPLKDVSPEAVDEAFGWVDGKLVVNNKPLRDVLPLFTRWFGVEVWAKDPSLLDRPVTMTAKLESLKEAISTLETAANLKFGYEGQKMVLADAPPKAAAPAAKKKKK